MGILEMIAGGRLVFRDRRCQTLYTKYSNSESELCALCSLPSSQIVRSFENIIVIKNRFPYSYWDACRVTQHLMVVPVNHVTEVDMLGPGARAEFHAVIDEFVGLGYSAYLRPAGSPSSSIVHLHCHLFRLVSPRISFQVFIRRPYWLWVRTR
jgi:hypothetical protein